MRREGTIRLFVWKRRELRWKRQETERKENGKEEKKE